jgi:hypothetical protein
MLTVLSGDPLATCFGAGGIICLLAWPLLQRALRCCWSISGFLGHYALLGRWTAVAMNGVLAAQTVLALGLSKTPRLSPARYALVPIPAIATIVTWDGTPSLLCVAATTLSTIGQIQGNETTMRCFLLASIPFWTTHDLMVLSLPGLVADVFSVATGVAMLTRRCHAGWRRVRGRRLCPYPNGMRVLGHRGAAAGQCNNGSSRAAGSVCSQPWLPLEG